MTRAIGPRKNKRKGQDVSYFDAAVKRRVLQNQTDTEIAEALDCTSHKVWWSRKAQGLASGKINITIHKEIILEPYQPKLLNEYIENGVLIRVFEGFIRTN